MFAANPRIGARDPTFWRLPRIPAKLLFEGERTPSPASYSPSNTDASLVGVLSGLVYVGSVKPLSVSHSSPGPRGLSYALGAGRPRAVDPMGGELAEGASPGWGRIAPGLAQAAVGRGAPGEVGDAGNTLRTWRPLLPVCPGASSGSDPRTWGWKGIGG